MSKTTGLASVSLGRSDIHRVDPRLLNIKPNWNSRDFNSPDNKLHIEELALSISEIGVKEPLTVQWEDGKAWVVDGECRYRATMHAINVLSADIKSVPVKAEERYANDAERLFNQRLRNSGKPFSAMEDAQWFKRLVDMGWQQGDIAKKLGISAARVSQILNYNTMPEGVKAMVVNGEVAPSTAMAVVKANGTAAEQQLKDGLAAAKAQGKTKVKGSDIEPRVNIKAAVKDAFEYADVDDSDSELVVIKMPAEQFEIIRKILGL